MNKLFLLLLFVFSLSTAGLATAQNRPKGSLKRAFNHSSEAGKGKNNKAQFRRDNIRPVIDLNPHTPEKFKTAKANHHYKFAKGR
ncbi:hypothetical protein MON38_05715 [Hymenobacter sp. DH14]|uniref:Uncharacterized protein n=1 Tax=Hymenobacter cyanobacteriorum TaxID=2926463 RepID=A0A9X2AHS2_9BACT|nr:hypothetical protein [Hymenobacter cyanobacteriorum]MCI1186909.1 hypothetical protein [Hymenobacter cyanobacteriorum]